MAWVSIIAMLVFSAFLFLPIFPDSRIKALADLFGLFYIGMAGVVGAYMGMTAYMSAKRWAVIKIYFTILLVGLIGGIGYGGYYYYKDTQNRIKVLTENNAKLEVARKVQDETIKTLTDDAKKFKELNKKLTKDMQKAETYRNNLIDKLRKHNLTRLSQKKPELVEKKINDGTQKLFDQLEGLTALPSSSPAK